MHRQNQRLEEQKEEVLYKYLIFKPTLLITRVTNLKGISSICRIDKLIEQLNHELEKRFLLGLLMALPLTMVGQANILNAKNLRKSVKKRRHN